MYDVASIGRVGVDLYSLDFNKNLKDVTKFAKYVGGGAANLAVGVSRLGLKCSVVSAVSDDELGEFVIQRLSSEGIDTRSVKKIAEAKTGIVFAEIFPGSKDSKFIFYREKAADLMIEKEDIEKSEVRNSRVVVVTGTGLSASPSREATIFALKLARDNQKIAVFNLDWRPSLWKNVEARSRLEAYSKGIELAQWLVGNEAEFMAATSTNSIESAIASIPSLDLKKLVITRGEKGSALIEGGMRTDVAPFEVETLKTLGGGDGILCGVIFGLLNGFPAKKTLKLGNAIGAIVVTRHSCSDAMPTLVEVNNFIEKNGGWEA